MRETPGQHRKAPLGLAVVSEDWTVALPGPEREEFFDALTSTVAACADVGSFEPLAHLIEGWRATAEVHANPALAELLSIERSGPAVKLKRPKAS